MSSSLYKLLQDLDNQKKAYHEKLLSADGEFSLLLRGFQVNNLIIDISNLIIPEFYFASLSNTLLFGFDLTFLEPVNLDFTYSFPDLDQWLNGIGVIIEKTTPSYITDLEQFINGNINPAYQDQIQGSMIVKGYYGKSAYGSAYYDPSASREFLRNAITLMFKKHPDITNRRIALSTMAKSLEINDDVVRDVHDRMSMVMTAHTECFMLNYGFLNISNLCAEAEHSESHGIVPYIDFDGEYKEVEVDMLADMQYGCILDTTLLDYCYLMPDEDIYKPDAPVIMDALDSKLKNFRNRLSISAPALSNYVRGDEAGDYRKCERTEVFGELLSMRYTIEHQAEVFLNSAFPGLDNFEKRKYKTAVLHLVGSAGKRHEWGFGVYKVMDSDELKDWWIQYWTQQGLDANVLEQIYNNMKSWLPDIVAKKVDLGKKLRTERLGIPLD